MKSIFNLLIVLSLVLSTTSGYTQIKNPKTDTVKIFGNCDMCKSIIEKAGNLKNIAKVTWNKDSKMAEITFDSKKTNRNEILKRIALAGYNSDEYLAPDSAYAQLAECCKYERLKKEPVIAMDNTKMEMDMPESKMEMNIPSVENQTDKEMPSSENQTDMVMSEMKVTNPLEIVFNTYFDLKDAFVKTNAISAAAKSSELLTALKDLKIESLTTEAQNKVNKVMPSMMDATKSISETKDIAKQREKFKVLSKNMHGIVSFYKANETLYYQYCPMQDANWLSKEKIVKNPYYGSQMLSCGSTVETIKSKN